MTSPPVPIAGIIALAFYIITLIGIALVSVHYRRKYEELKRLIIPEGWRKIVHKNKMLKRNEDFIFKWKKKI